MSKLIRGNELESGFILGRILNADGELLRTTAKYLSRRCEKLRRWDLGVDLLKTVDGCEDDIWMFCARSSGSVNEINQVHERARIASMNECFLKAEELLEEQKYFDAFKYYLVSATPELALDIGLNLVREILLREWWDLKDINVILQLLGCIRTEKLQSTKLSRQRHELLVITAYTGALLAIRRKYIPIVTLLFSHARYLINKENVNLSVSGIQIEKENKAWLMYLDSSFKKDSENAENEEEFKKTWNDLNRRIGPNKSNLEEGVDMVVGSHLPNSSNTRISVLTGKRIKGPVFILEDGQSAMSLNNALMWAKVNPFSPLATGARINPF